MYDQMEDGVCSVRFKTPEAALACVKVKKNGYGESCRKRLGSLTVFFSLLPPPPPIFDTKLMNGRYFAGRKIEASIYDGSRKLHKVKERDAGDESRRLDAFSEWIEGFDSDDEEDE